MVGAQLPQVPQMIPSPAALLQKHATSTPHSPLTSDTSPRQSSFAFALAPLAGHIRLAHFVADRNGLASTASTLVGKASVSLVLGLDLHPPGHNPHPAMEHFSYRDGSFLLKPLLRLSLPPVPHYPYKYAPDHHDAHHDTHPHTHMMQSYNSLESLKDVPSPRTSPRETYRQRPASFSHGTGHNPGAHMMAVPPHVTMPMMYGATHGPYAALAGNGVPMMAGPQVAQQPVYGNLGYPQVYGVVSPYMQMMPHAPAYEYSAKERMSPAPRHQPDPNHALVNKRCIIKRRTRTGCLTCRKRRIKCDERKPHCFNCERSKKLCLGYELLPSARKEPEKDGRLLIDKLL